MYVVYFDSGTSNIRGYLLKTEGNLIVIDSLELNVGSKDSSISGSNKVFILGLYELYNKLLGKNKITDRNVHDIYASGMITSPFGLKEVSHIPTPVSLDKLYQNIYIHFEPELFKREIHLIRGVKTVSENTIPCLSNIGNINNMRGEEIEAFGILADIPDEYKNDSIAIFLPGSHTHILHTRHGELLDVLSTFSGELYHAISADTILSHSILPNDDFLDKSMILMGFENLKKYGVNRALYIAHAMKIFNVCNSRQRKSYLEGVINGGVVLAFDHTMRNKWKQIDKILIAGSNIGVANVYKILLEKKFKRIKISTIKAPRNFGFAAMGFMEILKKEREKCQNQF